MPERKRSENYMYNCRKRVGMSNFLLLTVVSFQTISIYRYYYRGYFNQVGVVVSVLDYNDESRWIESCCRLELFQPAGESALEYFI